MIENELSDVQQDGEHHTWSYELTDEAEKMLIASCYAEIYLQDDRQFVGWIDVEDRLGIAPEAKRQLVLLDAIASDPLECKAKDVVKFIELLQRNLKGNGRSHSLFAKSSGRNKQEGYEETPIQRRLLLESGTTHAFSQALILNQLLNRSLDSALRDLHFFGRDRQEGGIGKKSKSEGSASHDTRQDKPGTPSLPPKIQTVLTQLFAQLADAFDASGSARETARLIGQIPTCIKALAFASARWLPRSQSQRLLFQYFHKVAVACLAPGIASLLHKSGAVRRLTPEERKHLSGGPGFVLGVSMLEVYLVLQFQQSSQESQRVLRDMYDVLAELPMPNSSDLIASAEELLHIQPQSTRSISMVWFSFLLQFDRATPFQVIKVIGHP